MKVDTAIQEALKTEGVKFVFGLYGGFGVKSDDPDIRPIEVRYERARASIIEQLAKNKYLNQEAIDRIKKGDIHQGIIENYWWQKINEKLEEIPKIREEMGKEKDKLIQSGNYKKIFGIKDNSITITKDMIGKEKLDEIRRELSEIK